MYIQDHIRRTCTCIGTCRNYKPTPTGDLMWAHHCYIEYFRDWNIHQIAEILPAVGVGARVREVPRVPQQPPNENGASYHEDRQRAEAPPDPPLTDEKTDLLLEEREHRNTQYPTSVHLSIVWSQTLPFP